MPIDRDSVRVSVAFSPGPGVVDEVALTLRSGATLSDAVRESGLQARYPEFDLAALPTGVWGAFRAADHALNEGDRVELYRPLRVDPMEARRLRQRATEGARLVEGDQERF